MNTVTLQIPISKTVRDNATIAAKGQGFSSLQEIVRVLLTNLSSGQLSVSVQGERFPATKLSRKNEKRYLKMEQDFKNGKNVYRATSFEDFMNQLEK